MVGALGTLLAAVGLYGLLTYAVSERTQEIGIRMALGAQRRDVTTMVVGEAARLAAWGSLIGLTVAFGSTRLVANLLYGVGPTDPLSFALATSMTIGVAVMAGWLPARRATKVDPLIALRSE